MADPTSSFEPDGSRTDRLVAEAQCRSREEIGESFESFRPGLYRQARLGLTRPLARKESASDVVQETFLMAFRHLGDFRGQRREELKAWIEAVQAHRLIAVRRRHERAAKRAISREARSGNGSTAMHLLDHLSDHGPSPSQQVQCHERFEALEQAIGLLSDEEQRLIRWKYHDELGPTEIGQLLGCSADAARMRAKRAEEHLRRLLGPDHDP